MASLVYGGKGYVLVEEVFLDDEDHPLFGKRCCFVRWEGGSRTGPFKDAGLAQEYANRNGGRWMRAEAVR